MPRARAQDLAERLGARDFVAEQHETRRGPIEVMGLARSDQMGSVKMLIPLCWSNSVEWLISVTRSSLPSTQGGGFDGSMSETKRADGSGRLVSFHRRTSRKPWASGASGLKKRFPSKCVGNGSEPACCTTLIYSQFSGRPSETRVVEAGLIHLVASNCRGDIR